MPINLVNPDGVPANELYHHVAVASGSKLIFIAGQVASGADGTVVGAGDLAAQVERCYLNVASALAGVGATFEHVAKLTVYLVDWTPDKMEQFVEGRGRAMTALGVDHAPPLTGIGVAALAEPDLLVEIEATAVLD
ncbi:RidA family protein [Mycolicibacterium sp. GCM10028919]|uniref:RidA family protein n=1 Tax=Mycolicibacterium sp. GCM10028919 TaxID=3273401 RepID=UPI00361A2FDF